MLQFRWCVLPRPVYGELFETQIAILLGIGELLRRKAVAAAQLQHAVESGRVHLAVAEKSACGVEQFAIASVGHLLRYLRQMRREDRDRLAADVALGGPNGRGGVGAG